MDILQGGNSGKIAGANIGDTVLIKSIDGKVEKVILSAINRIGVEGFQTDLTNSPLNFYPYPTIIKITKFTPYD